jgi:hypothetical protein
VSDLKALNNFMSTEEARALRYFVSVWSTFVNLDSFSMCLNIAAASNRRA